MTPWKSLWQWSLIMLCKHTVWPFFLGGFALHKLADVMLTRLPSKKSAACCRQLNTCQGCDTSHQKWTSPTRLKLLLAVNTSTTGCLVYNSSVLSVTAGHICAGPCAQRTPVGKVHASDSWGCNNSSRRLSHHFGVKPCQAERQSWWRQQRQRCWVQEHCNHSYQCQQ